MQLARRAATVEDIPFLLALRRETMDAHLAASGMDTSDASHRARLLHHFEYAQILLRGATPVGLLKLRRLPGEWEIVQLQLASELRGQGTGSALLQQILAEATRSRVAVKLSVLKSNPARRLYERLGFQHMGEDEHEYHLRWNG